ncbi:hypothetical protein M9H77_18103 [Catharanthus roseus]|uniref:Uncharacterized protein n=1 Tax=Catharanthus roseus TaxID=4058 RepID=A0ACC0B6J0_CATRO|nr:hypothetical protein M9H77_18103 [Catharanthus roseus]
MVGSKSSFSVGWIDPCYVLIRFDLEEYYIRFRMKGLWNFQGYLLRVLKWTPNFQLFVESSILPIWVNFEDLLIYFINKATLFSIASTLGKSLKIDKATTKFTRPTGARVCSELDLLKSLPQRVWIWTSPSTATTVIHSLAEITVAEPTSVQEHVSPNFNDQQAEMNQIESQGEGVSVPTQALKETDANNNLKAADWLEIPAVQTSGRGYSSDSDIQKLRTREGHLEGGKTSFLPLWKRFDRTMVNSEWSNFFTLSKLENLTSNHSPLLFSFRHTFPRGFNEHKNVEIFQRLITRLMARMIEGKDKEMVALFKKNLRDLTWNALERENEYQNSTKTFQISIIQERKTKRSKNGRLRRFKTTSVEKKTYHRLVQARLEERRFLGKIELQRSLGEFIPRSIWKLEAQYFSGWRQDCIFTRFRLHLGNAWNKKATKNKKQWISFNNLTMDRVVTPFMTIFLTIFLLWLPSLEEVRDAIFSLYRNSAPGSDGFSGAFFQHCWTYGAPFSMASQTWSCIRRQRIIVPLILMEKINSNPQLLRDPLVLFSYISQAKGWTLREEYLRGHALSLQSKKSFPTRTIVLNIDGASKGNQGLATTGGVLYFDDGTFIKRFAHYHGENNSNSFAEVMAMLYGTLITIDMRFSSFMIESDSLTVVSMVQGSSTVPWEIG